MFGVLKVDVDGDGDIDAAIEKMTEIRKESESFFMLNRKVQKKAAIKMNK